MGSERLDTTQRFSIEEQLDGGEEPACRFARAEIETEHGSESALLFKREFMLGMGLEAGIGEPLDLWLRGQELGDGPAVLLVLLHAQGQSANTAQNQEG